MLNEKEFTIIYYDAISVKKIIESKEETFEVNEKINKKKFIVPLYWFNGYKNYYFSLQLLGKNDKGEDNEDNSFQIYRVFNYESLPSSSTLKYITFEVTFSLNENIFKTIEVSDLQIKILKDKDEENKIKELCKKENNSLSGEFSFKGIQKNKKYFRVSFKSNGKFYVSKKIKVFYLMEDIEKTPFLLNSVLKIKIEEFEMIIPQVFTCEHFNENIYSKIKENNIDYIIFFSEEHKKDFEIEKLNKKVEILEVEIKDQKDIEEMINYFTQGTYQVILLYRYWDLRESYDILDKYEHLNQDIIALNKDNVNF